MLNGQGTLDRYVKRKRGSPHVFNLRVRLSPRGRLLLVLLLFMGLLVFMPVQSSDAYTDTCGGIEPFGHSATPNGMAPWLWGLHQSELINEYPQLAQDQGKATSQVLKEMVNGNTSLAQELSARYNFGVTDGTSPNHPSIQPYAVYWNPSYIYIPVGSSVMQLYACIHDEMGFDNDFTAAAINLIHARTMFMQSGGAEYSLYGGSKDLDPAVYGKNPYTIVFPEVGFVLRRDGHVYFGNPCPFEALYYYNNATPPAVIGEESVAACFGGHHLFLIVPEEVCKEIGYAPIYAASGFLNFVYSGAITELFSFEQQSAPPIRSYQPNWLKWQNGYHKLMDALSNYHVEGLDWNFAAFTRVPLDTRLPNSLGSKVLWQALPAPQQIMTDALAGASVTIQGLYDRAVVMDGHAMATKYAQQVYDYLGKFGLWTYAQSIIRPWLTHYYDNNALHALSDFDVQIQTGTGYGKGQYAYFQYQDAFARSDLTQRASQTAPVDATDLGTAFSTSETVSKDVNTLVTTSGMVVDLTKIKFQKPITVQATVAPTTFDLPALTDVPAIEVTSPKSTPTWSAQQVQSHPVGLVGALSLLGVLGVSVRTIHSIEYQTFGLQLPPRINYGQMVNFLIEEQTEEEK